MGTPGFAVEPLRRLIEGGYQVVGVVTVPDKPAGRGLKLRESAVKEYALSQGLPIYQPEKLKDPEWLAEWEKLRPDLAIVVAFRMLPEIVWSLPRLGTFNLHASLLPQYRGAAPINWAIMNGEPTTGVTTFFLNDRIDCGTIIDQREVEIAPDDTAGTLHDKLMETGAALVVETVEKIAGGNIEGIQQAHLDESSLKPAPKIFKQDCLIAPADWYLPAAVLYNKIRGLSPYPAAWCALGNEGVEMKILEAHPVPCEAGIVGPGTFETDGKNWLRVSCSDGWIYIDRLQVAGKKSMDIADFLRGYRFGANS